MSSDNADKRFRDALQALRARRNSNGRFNLGNEYLLLSHSLGSMLRRTLSLQHLITLIEALDSDPSLTISIATDLLSLNSSTSSSRRVSARIACNLELGSHLSFSSRLGKARMRLLPADDQSSTEHQDRISQASIVTSGQASPSSCDLSPRSFLEVSFDYEGSDSLIRNAHSVLETASGVIELALKHCTVTMVFGRPSHSSSRIIWGHLIPLVDELNLTVIDVYSMSYPTINGEVPVSPVRRVEESDLLRLSTYLNIVNTRTNSPLGDIFLSCCYLYKQAIEHPDTHIQLLHYWQILEEIAISKRYGGKTKEVCARIARICPMIHLDYNLVCYILTQVAEQRNSIVHRGRCVVSDDDCRVVKIIADQAMLFMLNALHHLDSEADLDWYYRLVAANDAEVRACDKISRIVLEQRTQ